MHSGFRIRLCIFVLFSRQSWKKDFPQNICPDVIGRKRIFRMVYWGFCKIFTINILQTKMKQ